MKLLALTLLMLTTSAFSQLPAIERGVPQDLAKWRAAHYSDIRYKLDLTLEKMSPVLKGHMEIRVNVRDAGTVGRSDAATGTQAPPPARPEIVLDWRKLPGHEKDSTVSNVYLDGTRYTLRDPNYQIDGIDLTYQERDDHLIFDYGVKTGENVITLDFTSPILTSGSAITRYIDKEDGSEYIYSLFVPSDASTAFPVFDQPDLKARFTVSALVSGGWTFITNSAVKNDGSFDPIKLYPNQAVLKFDAAETQPISTYVFAFAAGPWTQFEYVSGDTRKSADETYFKRPRDPNAFSMNVFVRKSQTEKFKAHRMDVFHLTESAVKYLETYFDYKFPWPKYDLVLIPEFPFGGMEHAGATFLKESSVIFPTEPTKGDLLSRANVIFHETAHQWFGDLVTMRWFDDLWLKEGFAEFMAYKTLEHVMPEANAWKVFYERNKQAAYATDSTRGTTPIYQPISNLSAAKSAYGNIVYRKAPSFLRQAEFYLGEDKFQTAVRAFLKKHEYANAGWEGLVGEFETASGQNLQDFGRTWVTQRGMPVIRICLYAGGIERYALCQSGALDAASSWPEKVNVLTRFTGGVDKTLTVRLDDRTIVPKVQDNKPNYYESSPAYLFSSPPTHPAFVLPNYGDYGYGIFLLDDKSRDYVLKHIGEEKDPFLRSMMWGALWDSVREAELDPREYVELVIRQLPTETDETTAASLLGRVSTALNYYVSDEGGNPSVSSGVQRRIASTSHTLPNGPVSASRAAASVADLRSRFEAILLDRMQHAATPGQRITFYRAFVSNASTEHGRTVLKQMLASAGGSTTPAAKPATPPKQGGESVKMTLRTKDKFDIVTRLIVLGDPDAAKLLADLERTETSDDAKRYAYAAHAAFATAENRAKFWSDFVNNKDISESWIEAAIGPFNSIRHPELSQPYLERALKELPNLKRTRKIFFINNWLAAWLGGQRDQAALDIVNKFLADNPNLDNDLRLKVLENVDVIERAVKIRQRWEHGVTMK